MMGLRSESVTEVDDVAPAQKDEIAAEPSVKVGDTSLTPLHDTTLAPVNAQHGHRDAPSLRKKKQVVRETSRYVNGLNTVAMDL